MQRKFDLERILKGFSQDQLRYVFKNIGAIELTTGCSIGCDFCGFDAEKGVKSKIKFNDLVFLVEKFGVEMKTASPMLFWATDPLDWAEDEKTYQNVSELFETKAEFRPYVSTAVPRGKEELMFEMLMQGKIDRVSVSHMNRNRLRDLIESKFPVVKTQTFNVIEHHSGKRELGFLDKPNQYGKRNWLFLLADLVVEHSQNRFYAAQNEKTVRNSYLKVGKKHLDNLDGIGISCYHGTILTEAGLFNQETVVVTKEHPHGIIRTPISPNQFGAYHFWSRPINFIEVSEGHAITKFLTKVGPIDGILTPVLANTLPESDKHTKEKQALLSIYAFAINLFEKYNYDFRAIMDDAPTMTVMTVEENVRLHEKILAEAKVQLSESNPYDGRILSVRERYGGILKRLRPWLYNKK